MENIKEPDRYVSFKDIDCFGNAKAVVDEVLLVLEHERYGNPFWEQFVTKIPSSYYENDTKDEKLLYLVCANVFYIEELFENAEHEKGEEALKRCEFDCC